MNDKAFAYSSEGQKPTIKEFRVAFNKARSEFKTILKAQDNPFFKSKYASLSDIHEAVDIPLRSHGFTLHQLFRVENGMNILVTKLCHESGFSEISEILLKSKDDQDPQKVKSSATYYRRIALEALLAVPTEDDDGNHAAEPAHPKTYDPTIPKTNAHSGTKVTKGGKPISEAQVRRLWALANQSHADVNKLLESYGYKEAAHIGWKDYEDICNEIQKPSKPFRDPSEPPDNEPPMHTDMDIPF